MALSRSSAGGAPPGQTRSLPAGVLSRARDAFLRFAEASPDRDEWLAIAAGAESPDLPVAPVVVGRPVFLRRRENLDAIFGPARPPRLAARAGRLVLSVDTRADDLWAFAQRLPEGQRLALDALLRRAVQPAEALATWPLETFFSADEAAHLHALGRQETPVDTEVTAWVAGRDMSYRGYVCAILKLTRLCNLRCTYCHDWRSGPDQVMPFAVQAAAFAELVGRGRYRVVDIVWHGGEPTLLGRRQFLRVLALQRWFRRPGQRLKNIVQTNATTITAEWARFLARYGFSVGVSLDGPPEVHDAVRPRTGGRPSSAAVRRGLELLRQAGALDGVLLVVSREVLALGAAAVVRFLREAGITEVGMLPVRPGSGSAVGSAESYIDPRTFARFLVEVHRTSRETTGPPLRIREVAAALAALSERSPGFCELMGNCIGSFFSIDTDGSIAHCDKYVGDSAYVLGNLLSHDLDRILGSSALAKLAEENRSATALMKRCRHFERCRGWCPHERYSGRRYDPAYDPTCCGLAPLFDSLEESLDGYGVRQ